MHKDQRRSGTGPDLLPWQGVLMVAAVTMAGLLHEHPQTVRPLLAKVEAARVQLLTQRLVPIKDRLGAGLVGRAGARVGLSS